MSGRYIWWVPAGSTTGAWVPANRSTPTTPEPPAGANGFDANGVKLTAPTVVMSGSVATVTAVVETNRSVTFQYLQIATRGPVGSGVEFDGGFATGATLNAGVPRTLSFTTTTTVAGQWTAFAAYKLASAAEWVDGPNVSFTGTVTTTPTIPPPPAGNGGKVHNFPILGRSGLSWNSGVFNANGTPSSCEAFGTWRGRPIDSTLFFTTRDNWSNMNWIRPEMAPTPYYKIIAIPSQPEGLNNSSTASGSNNTFWTQWAQNNLKNKGFDPKLTIVRLNWECNLTGNHYAFNKPDPATFVRAYRQVHDAVSSVFPCYFNLCLNKSNVINGIDWRTQIYDPLKDIIDIAGLDWYNHGPRQNTQAEFDTARNQNPGGESMANWCRANGKGLWLDEWMCSRGNLAGGWPGGGDDPAWVQRMWDWMNKNNDVMAGETCYNDDGAPSTLLHKIWPNGGSNPNSSVRYKALWGR